MSEQIMQFSAPIELTAAAAGEGKRPTFSIAAYSGSPIRLAGFPTPVIIDLSGLQASRAKLPILVNHDLDRPVGQADIVRIDAAGVELSGTITGDDEDARRIISHARNGFEWQASVGVNVVRREFLESGKTATVNGRQVSGPMLIARQSMLVETSFVTVGADQNTAARVAAIWRKGMSIFGKKNVADTEPQNADMDVFELRRRIIAADALLTPPACGWADRAGDVAEIKAAYLEGTADDEQVQASVASLRRDVELQHIRASRPQLSAFTTNGHSSGPDQRLVAEAGLLLLCGYEGAAAKLAGGRAAEVARDMRLTNLRAWADFTGRLNAAGSLPDIQAGFSTAALGVLMSSIPRMLLQEFEQAPASCDSLADWRLAPDFKEQSIYRLLVGGGLEEIGGDGEIKHGTLKEFDVRIQLGTFAKMFQISRRTIINDDAGAITTIPRVLALEASRLRGEKFATLLNDNPGDFFHADNANLITGATTNLSFPGLKRAIVALRSQTDEDGRALNLRPTALLVPPALEVEARQLVNSTALLAEPEAGEVIPSGNPYQAMNLTIEVEPRLSSEKVWYLLARPSDAAVVIGTLNGQRVPTIEMPDAPANVLGSVIRGYYDFAIVLAEPRAAVKSAGE